ncbi:MAG: tRNA-intron lyase [Candidatus Ranarchaeia archaeon]
MPAKKAKKAKKSKKTKKSAKSKKTKKEAEVSVVKPVEMKPEIKDKPKKSKVRIKCLLVDERLIAEPSDEARELYNQSRYGHIEDDGRLQMCLIEGLYLLDKGKIDVVSKRKKLNFGDLLKKGKDFEPNLWIRYCVFRDMRNRGYIIKTALKFGADFRVYDRGVKPGEDHARWIIYPVHEGSTMTWYEFSAKNRVAHSTKKRLMMGVVDDEGDVTYWEIRWMRP